MSRLIDADALEAEFAGRPPDWYSTGTILRSIDSAPTIDAVPVVRCWECRYWVGDFPGATEHVKRCEKKNFTESGKLHTIDKECARRYLEGKIFFGFIIDAFNRIINRINEIEDVINQK